MNLEETVKDVVKQLHKDLQDQVANLEEERDRLKRDNAVMSDQLPMLHEKVKTLREDNARLHERYVQASRKADAATAQNKEVVRAVMEDVPSLPDDVVDEAVLKALERGAHKAIAILNDAPAYAAGKPSQSAADMGYTLTPEQVATQGKMLDDALKQNDEWVAKDRERDIEIGALRNDLHAARKTLNGRVWDLENKLRNVADINGLIHTLFESDIQPFDERLKLVEELCKLRFPTSDQDGVRYRAYPTKDDRR